MSYTIVPFEPVLIDTNVLIYSLDTVDVQKHSMAMDFIGQRLQKRHEIVLCDQNITEFFAVAKKRSFQILQTIAFLSNLIHSRSVRLIQPTPQIMASALILGDRLRMSYWDALLAETMFENNVFTICTEGEGFRNDRRLNVINPFKKMKK